jgi:hypothetical protein
LDRSIPRVIGSSGGEGVIRDAQVLVVGAAMIALGPLRMGIVGAPGG